MDEGGIGKINQEIKFIQIPESEELEERISDILSLRPEETPEEYTYRVAGGLREYFYRSLKEPYVLNEQIVEILFGNRRLCQKFLETLNNLSVSQGRQSKEKDREVLDRLNFSIGAAYTEVPEDKNEFEKQDIFKRTNQERKFFSETKSIGGYAYSYMMFGLPDYFARRTEMKNYIHSILDDKTIFLFGGGDSVKDLLSSEEYKPKRIINFDPYLKDESVGKRTNINYESRAISASDRKIEDLVAAGELPKADEIWATYSVPPYLNKSKDIAWLIQNIASVLNEGGVARIFPIAVQKVESGSETYEIRKNTLIQLIKLLMESDQFNVSLFGKTLKIHKLKKF